MPQNILIIGNSDGIGAAVTRELIARGDRVCGISRSPSPLGPDGPKHIVQDISAPEYPDTLHRIIVEEGSFDACIFCAAIGSGLELPNLSQEAQVIEVNFNNIQIKKYLKTSSFGPNMVVSQNIKCNDFKK